MKNTLFKSFALSKKTPVLESFLKKLQVWRPQNRCFPVEIAKFLSLPISKNIWERLVFDCFNGSLLHRPKGSRSRLYDSVRLQGPSHSSRFFVFKTASLVLKRVPTCVRKPKTNTFDRNLIAQLFIWNFDEISVYQAMTAGYTKSHHSEKPLKAVNNIPAI